MFMRKRVRVTVAMTKVYACVRADAGASNCANGFVVTNWKELGYKYKSLNIKVN